MRYLFSVLLSVITLTCFAQQVEFDLDVVTANTVNYDPDSPSQDLFANFIVMGRLLSEEPYDLGSYAYHFVEVKHPDDWSIESMMLNMGAHLLHYPPNMGISDAPDEEIYDINLMMMGLDLGDSGQGGTLEIKLAMALAQDLTISDTVTLVLNLCASDNQLELISYNEPTPLCPGMMLDFSAPAGFENYAWTGGQTGQNISLAIETPFVQVAVTDDQGCIFQDEVLLDLQRPAEQPLCLITVDEVSGNNKLIWEKTEGQGTTNYNIYKQGVQANIYELVAAQPFAELTEYVDSESNPSVQSERYQITTTDVCVNESAPLTSHKTMHLTSNLGINNQANLIWEKYEGFNYSTFNIYRGTTAIDLVLIAERPSNTFTFTDINPPAGNLYYQIAIVAPQNCEPGEAVNIVQSNISQINSVNTQQAFSRQVNIFPNPVQDQLQLEGLLFNGQKKISLYNTLGQLVFTQKADFSSIVKVNLATLSPGFYHGLIEGVTGGFTFIKE